MQEANQERKTGLGFKDEKHTRDDSSSKDTPSKFSTGEQDLDMIDDILDCDDIVASTPQRIGTPVKKEPMAQAPSPKRRRTQSESPRSSISGVGSKTTTVADEPAASGSANERLTGSGPVEENFDEETYDSDGLPRGSYSDQVAEDSILATDYNESIICPDYRGRHGTFRRLQFGPWQREPMTRTGLNDAIHYSIEKYESGWLKRKMEDDAEKAEKETEKRRKKGNVSVKKTSKRRKGNQHWKSGCLYILTSPHCPGKVKIGVSRNPSKRLKKWSTDCDLELHLVPDSENAHLPHAGLAETLIQHDLHNQRLRLNCGHCTRQPRPDSQPRPVQHQEWFQIDVPTALRTVRKWRAWIADGHYPPFDRYGRLQGVWKTSYEHFKLHSDTVDVDDWARPLTRWKREALQMSTFASHVADATESSWTDVKPVIEHLLYALNLPISFGLFVIENITLVLFSALILASYAVVGKTGFVMGCLTVVGAVKYLWRKAQWSSKYG